MWLVNNLPRTKTRWEIFKTTEKEKFTNIHPKFSLPVAWARPDVGRDFLRWPVSNSRTHIRRWASGQPRSAPVPSANQVQLWNPDLDPSPDFLSAQEGARMWAGLRGRGHLSQSFYPSFNSQRHAFGKTHPIICLTPLVYLVSSDFKLLQRRALIL